MSPVEPDLLSAFDSIAAKNELEAALLVNQAIDQTIDLPAVHDEVLRLGDGCVGEPWAYLAELGFKGNREDYTSLQNSCIADVLKLKKGLPISLGVLLIQVARCSGQTAHGINFPGHFLVRVGNTLIDPFDMVVTSENERLAAIEQDRTSVDMFEPISTESIALRMLNNVKYQFAREHSWNRALDMLSCQCAIVPDEAVFHFERGEIWRQLGAMSAAQDAYTTALGFASDSGIIKACRKRIAETGGGSGLVH
jgi:regulator of sirC expression with transglutaminase-like and TPR domain